VIGEVATREAAAEVEAALASPRPPVP